MRHEYQNIERFDLREALEKLKARIISDFKKKYIQYSIDSEHTNTFNETTYVVTSNNEEMYIISSFVPVIGTNC